MLALCIALLIGCGRDESARLHGECATDSARLAQLVTDADDFRDLLSPAGRVDPEFTNESILGGVSIVRRHPAGLLIIDTQQKPQAFLFKRDGTFLAKLGSTGEGPGEFSMLRDGAVASNGNVLLLSMEPAKLLEFAPTGVLVREIQLRELGIRPTQMRLVEAGDTRWVLFYNLDADFPGASAGEKVVVARLTDAGLEFENAFGSPEPALRRLLFHMGGFDRRDGGDIWVSKVLELDTEIYDRNGEFVRLIDDPRPMLPGPHLSADLLRDYQRPSDALPTFQTTTRLIKTIHLDQYVINAYFSGVSEEIHLLFYTECGDLVPRSLVLKEAPLFYGIRGAWADTVAVVTIPDDDAKSRAESANPSIQLFSVASIRDKPS